MSTRKRNRKASTATRRSLLVGSAMLVSLSIANADPQGGIVVDGHGSITQSTGSTLINQSSNSLTVNWQSFNVGANESVKFEQPSSVSVAVNRILDQNPSQIFGRIDANGRVVLINPNGMVFGRTAQLNVGSLIATSLDAMTVDGNGKYSFRASRNNVGAIVNQGSISAAAGGSISLLGGTVTNEGLIVADYGTVNLAAGRAATLDFFGNGLLRLEVADQALDNSSGAAAAVNNAGTIRADGGQVLLTAAATNSVFARAVNNDGLISAKRIDASGGVIRLVGADGTVVSSGTLDASGATASSSGGLVQVLGDRVGLLGNAVVDVSGAVGGGTALIGGDFQGKNPEIQNAQRTVVSEGASIKADATVAGDGGKVIVWSDNTTLYRGNISAQGGAGGGNGGFAEVSGKQNLGFAGHVNLTAPQGSTGKLLLDPDNITIDSTGTDDTEIADNTILATDGTSPVDFSISAAAVVTSLDTADTSLAAANSITVSTAVDASGNTNAHDLSLVAPTITLTTGITLKTGSALTLDAATAVTGAGALTADTINFNGAGAVGSSGGRISTAGAVVLNKSGGATWLSTGAVDISGTTGGLLDMVSTGNITQAGGALSVTGTTTINPANHVIDLTDAGNSFGGAVSIQKFGAQSAAITSSGALQFGTTTLGSGNFDVIAGGDITQSGATTITSNGGVATFTTASGSSILLGNANTFNGDVAFAASSGTLQNVTLRDTTDFTLQNAGLSIGGNLNINAAGITQGAGALVVPGTATLTAGGNAITLNTATNNFGTLALNNTGGSGAVSITDTDAVVLGTSSLGTGTLDIAAGGNITQSGAITQAASAGNATFTAGSNAVNLNAGNDFTGSVVVSNSSGAGAVTINDVNALSLGGSTLGTGTFTVTAGGNISQSAAISQAGGAGFASFDAGAHSIALNSPTNNFTGQIRLNNSGGNTVGFFNHAAIVLGTSSLGTSTIDIANDIGNITQAGGGATFTTGTGSTTTFHGNGNSIDLGNAGNTFNGSVAFSTSGGPLQNVTLLDTTAYTTQGTLLNLTGNLNITAAGVTQGAGALQVIGTSSFTAGANAITLTNSSNNFTGAVSLSNSGANAVQITDTNAIALGTVGVGSGALTVNASGAITQTGVITQSGAGAATFNAGANAITLTNASNNFQGAVSLNNSGPNNVAVTDVDAIVLGTSAVGTGTFTVDAVGITQAGAITQTAGATSATFHGGAGVITLTDAGNDFTGPVLLDNSGASAVAIRDANTIDIGTSAVGSGTLAITATGITQSGSGITQAGAGAVTLTAGASGIALGNTNNDFQGAVSLTSTGGTVTIFDADSLAMGTATSAGNMTLTANNGTLSASGVLTVQNASGVLSLNSTSGSITSTQTNAPHLSIGVNNNAAITSTYAGVVAVDRAGVPGIFNLSAANGALFTESLGGVTGGTLNCNPCSLGGAITDLLAGTAGAAQDLSHVNFATENFTINSGGWANIAVAATNGLPAAGSIVLPGSGLADVFIRPITGTDLSTVGWSTTAITNVTASTRIGVVASGLLTVNGTVNGATGRFFDVDPGVLALRGANIVNDTAGHAFTFTLPTTNLLFASGVAAAAAPYSLTTFLNSFSGGTGGENLSLTQATALRLGQLSGGTTVGVDVGTGSASISSGGALTQQAGSSVVAQTLTLGGASIGSSGTPLNINTSLFNATSTAGGVYVQDPDAIQLGTISASGAGNDVTITAGGAITDDGSNATRVAANTLTLTGTAIGATGANNEIDTTATSLTATASAGGIWANETDTLTLTASATGGPVNVSTTAGTLTGNAVTGTGVILNAGGAGSALTMNGAITAGTGAVNLTSGGAMTLAGATGASATVNSGGALTLGTLNVGTGAANVTATGTITDGTTGTTITAGALTISGASIGSVGNTVSTNITSLNATSTAGGIYLQETNGIQLGTITASGAGNDVSITAGGAITDDADNTTRITANALTLSGTAIGAPGANNEVDTTVTSLNATASAGGIWANEADAVTLTASATGGPVNVSTTAGTLTGNAVTGTGVTLNAGGAGSALTMNGAVTAGTGAVNLTSAGAMTLAGATGASATVNSGAALTLGTLNVGTGAANVTAVGAITDAASGTAITAGALTISGASMGATTNPINTSVTSLTATASAGGIYIQEADAIQLGAISASGAGNDVSITAAGAITDDASNTTRIVANSLTLSGTAIGATGANNEIDTTVSSLTATASAGGIWANDADALTLTATATGGPVNVSTTAGALTGNAVTGTGVILNAGGAGSALTMNGAVTAGTGAVNLTSGGAMTLAGATGASATVTSGGALTLGALNVGTGAATLNATGAITDGTTGTAITAGALTLNGTSIGSSTNAINTTVTSLTATASAGGIYIQETDAIQLNAVVASGAGNDISITAGGAITDDNNSTTSVSGNALTLSATSIGAQGNDLDTSVADLTATATAGGVYIGEANDIRILQATAAGGSAAGSGSVQVLAGTTTTVATITSGTITARDSVLLAASGDIVGSPGKVITTPVAELRAGIGGATFGHIGSLATPVLFGPTLTALNMVLPVNSIADPSKPRFDPVVDGPATVIPQIYTYTGGSGFAAFYTPGVGTIPLNAYFGVTQGQFTGASSANIGAQAQTGDEQVFYIDWASFDPSVSLFGTLNPAMCLPADQQEDEEGGGACGGGGAVAKAEGSSWKGITLTANGWKPVRFFTRIGALPAKSSLQ